MSVVPPSPGAPVRYRIEPTVLQALRSPRILTREVLAGLVVANGLIPEAIAFSIIAGVDPRLGPFASSNDLTTQFDYAHDPERVVIDLTRSHADRASSSSA